MFMMQNPNNFHLNTCKNKTETQSGQTRIKTLIFKEFFIVIQNEKKTMNILGNK